MDPLAYYNSMQAQAGLAPPQVIFPGQVSAAIAAQGPVGAFGTLYPTQTFQTSIGAPPIFQGPTGIMAPMMPSSPYNPYAPSSSGGGVPAYGGFQGSPSPFRPYAPNPPPAYGGFQGQGAVPFAPPAPQPAFDTAYGGFVAQQQAEERRGWVEGRGAQGVMARLGANAAVGAAGAFMGRKAGPWGAFAGGMIGFLGAELSGFGQGAQNLHGDWSTGPRLSEQGMASGIEHLSRGFVSSGSQLNAIGQGFSHHAAHQVAHGITSLADSSSFRAETRDRFNTQDLSRMTQLGAQSGLMSGVNSSSQMVSQVRDIAKMVSAFTELAKEPDFVRAVQGLGNLRASGLNLHESLHAVSQGRTQARMAGTSFQGLMEVGGSIGSQTYQSMGLTQGLGVMSGMGNYAQAAASVNRGTLGPQLSSLAGGAQGLGTFNSMYSAAALQHPMTVPGLMGSAGGLDTNAVQGYLSGRHDVFSLTGRGSSVLGGIANRQGPEGLGQSIAMQPMLQDTLGRILQSQGPFAQRNHEDRQVMALAGQMNMRGAGGFLTAAQAMGMDRTQAVARATELGSETYWQGQRQQLSTDRREIRADRDREREENAPTFWGTLRHETALGSGIESTNSGLHHAGMSVSRFFGGGEGQTFSGGPTSEGGLFRQRQRARSTDFEGYQRRLSARASGDRSSLLVDARDNINLMEARGMRGAGAVLGAGLDVAFGGSSTDREIERRNYAAAGSFASSVQNATASDRRGAMSNVSSAFGDAGAAGEYAERLAAVARNSGGTGRSVANGAFRGIVMGLTNTAVDPGNIMGSSSITGDQQYNAYRDTMRRRGWDDDRIATTWREQQGNISGAVSTFQRASGQGGTERAAWDATSSNESRWRGRGGYLAGAREDLANANTRLLGDVGSAAQESFRGALDQTTGVGRTGSRQSEVSRRMIVALASANVANRQDGSRYGRRSGALATEMAQQAQREGIDFSAVSDRASSLADRMREDHGFQTAARGFMDKDTDPRNALTRLGRYEDSVSDPLNAMNVALGSQLLGGSGGVLSEVLGGSDASSHNPEEMRRKLAAMTPEQLRRLRSQRGGARLADMVGQLNSGDSRTSSAAMRNITGLVGDLGVEGRQLQDRWRSEHSVLNRLAPTRLRDAMMDSAVSEQMRASSPGERSGIGGLLESVGTQDEARSNGLGGAADSLRSASEQMNEAARNLNEAVNRDGLSSLLGNR